MHLFGKRLATILAISLLTACASTSGPAFQLPPVAEDKATIYAFRTSSIVGGGNSDIVSVNERFIGRLNSGTYAVHETTPGEVRIARKAGSILGSGQSAGWGLGGVVGAIDGFQPIVTFKAEAGHIYFIRFPHGEQVENRDALEMMGGLDQITP